MLTRLVVFLAISFGSSALVAIRPWRFWQESRCCHQCKTALPRRVAWGWDEELDCLRCGCRVCQ
jgi:hypothetical protein